MKITNMLWKVLGNKFAYRLGRALYMHARGDIANEMATNGELMVQRCVIGAIKRSTNDKLVCFDVGANVGDWSSALLLNCQSDQFQSLELYVFEPVPSTASILKKRLGENEHIHYELLAMSSSGGTDLIFIHGEFGGTNSLHCERSDSPPQSISIDKITASQFCLLNSIDVIHLLKIDAEGHDMEIIVGALPLLKKGKVAVLQFEYNHRWIFSRHYLKDVFGAIASLPYRVGKICPDHIELYDKWHPEHERFFEANYVLIRDDAVSWFDVRECSLDVNNTFAMVSI